MTVMPDDSAHVKHFVKETLGCQCADAVFAHIETARVVGEDRGRLPILRIVVGRRLLIYLLERDAMEELATAMASLLRQGRRERDDNHYNRFRLVLTAPLSAAVRVAAEALFRTLPEADERVHLHVIEPSEIPALLRAPR